MKIKIEEFKNVVKVDFLYGLVTFWTKYLSYKKDKQWKVHLYRWTSEKNRFSNFWYLFKMFNYLTQI